MEQKYIRKIIRVEDLIAYKKAENIKKRIGDFFESTQELLREMDTYSRRDVLVINDLLQSTKCNISSIQNEFIRRGEGVK